MSRINKIQTKLLELEGGRFQKLCDSLLFRKYKTEIERIEPFGSELGTDKTVKGHPDSYFVSADGDYTFIEYSTQKTQVFKKIKEAISACIKENVLQVNSLKISRIIIFHLHKLTPEQDNELIKNCLEKHIELQIFGIGHLSHEICWNYPEIANEFLQISFDTGQIQSIEVFIREKSQLITLENEFLFRGSEMEQIEAGLKTNLITVISGKPGNGKTRLAIEALKKIRSERLDSSCYIMDCKAASVANDLPNILSGSEDLYLLIDDGNRFDELEYIIHALSSKQSNRHIGILVTIRDYALADVRSRLSAHKFREISLSALERNQLSEILRLRGIPDQLQRDMICDRAFGNPRIAIMAADVLLKANNPESIRDVFQIYKEFFSALDRKLSDKANEAKKVMAVISYFHVLNREWEIMQGIYEMLGVSEDDFWDCLRELYELELVDIFKDGRICKIADQIQATYYFYLYVICEEKVEFLALLNRFMWQNSFRMCEAIEACAYTFDFERVQQRVLPAILNLWEERKQENDFGKLKIIGETFWLFMPAENLKFLKLLLDRPEMRRFQVETTTIGVNPDRWIFQMLGQTCRLDDTSISMALELSCQFLESEPKYIAEFEEFIKGAFAYHTSAGRYLLPRHNLLFDLLTERGASSLILASAYAQIAVVFLKLNHESSFMEGMKFSIARFQIGLADHIIELHRKILSGLRNCSRDDLLRFLKEYSNAYRYPYEGSENSHGEAVRMHAEYLLPYAADKITIESVGDSLVVMDFLILLKKAKVQNHLISILENMAKTSSFNLYMILSAERYENLELRTAYGSWEKVQAKRKSDLKKHFGSLNLDDLRGLLEKALVISTELESRLAHGVSTGLTHILQNLVEKRDLFVQVIRLIPEIERGVNLEFGGAFYEYLIMHPNDHVELYEALRGLPRLYRSRLLFHFFRSITLQSHRIFYLEPIKSFFAEPHSGIQLNWSFFKEYETAQAGFTLGCLSRIPFNDGTVDFDLSYVFDEHGLKEEETLAMFSNDMGLLEKLAEHALQNPQLASPFTFLMKIIIDRDPALLERNFALWLRHTSVRRDRRRGGAWSFLWFLPNFAPLIKILIDTLNEHFDSYSAADMVIDIFKLKEKDDEILKRQRSFLQDHILKNSGEVKALNLIMPCLRKYFKEDFAEMVILIAHTNSDFEMFQALNIEKGMYSGSGSFIPEYLEMKKMWEEITAGFRAIQHLDHVAYARQMIRKWERSIELEEASLFVGRHYR